MEDGNLTGLLSVTPQPQPQFNRDNNCRPLKTTSLCDSGYFLHSPDEESVFVFKIADGDYGEALALANEAAGTFGQSKDVLRLTENRSSKITDIQMLHSSCIIQLVPPFYALHRTEAKRINCLYKLLFDH